MKGNSDLLINSVKHSYLLGDFFQSYNSKEKSFLNLSPEVEPREIMNANFFKHLWNRLVHNPQSFPQRPSTSISNIVAEETDSLALDSITTVLSKELRLPMNSERLSKAIEESIKIFHEDYPGDFILEYHGERLGLMMLDKCFDSTGNAKLIYRYNPDIKSFRGLF